MSEDIRDSFEEMQVQLGKLEKKYNPKGKNLHFASEAIPKVDEKLFTNLLQLSGEAIEIIKDEQDRYSNRTPYARAMFNFWYDYFLIISSASIRVKHLANPGDFSKETILGIIEGLIDISEFSIIVSGDLYKRNYEALGNTLLAFYDDGLIAFVMSKRKSISVTNGIGFLDMTLKSVGEIRKDNPELNCKTIIQRCFSDGNLKRVKTDFAFLMELIKNSKGELDFSIRDDYFNLYYKGNSLAKVSFKKNETYDIAIHKEFFSESKANKDARFNCKSAGHYFIVSLRREALHPFFQRKHLDDFCSKIRARNYQEEIAFEQNLITDNLNRQEFLFIDRQITDHTLKGQRIDLLGLKQIKENTNDYQFLVCEVKLGNNSELKDKVASQLNIYVSHIDNNFQDYKECYEKQYKQKKELGLFDEPKFNDIEIVQPVKGLIIVGGYSGIAKDQIKTLIKNYPNLSIKPIFYEL